jgi:hypothetical protein
MGKKPVCTGAVGVLMSMTCGLPTVDGVAWLPATVTSGRDQRRTQRSYLGGGARDIDDPQAGSIREYA